MEQGFTNVCTEQLLKAETPDQVCVYNFYKDWENIQAGVMMIIAGIQPYSWGHLSMGWPYMSASVKPLTPTWKEADELPF